MPSIPKPAPKMPSIPKPAPKMPSIPQPAPKKPTPVAKKSAGKLAPPRISFGSSAPTPIVLKKKTELLAMARAMKKEGYNVGVGYDILLKPDLAKRIENAKKAGKDSFRAKTVKNLKASAKRLDIKGAYAMKRANLISAIRRKRAA